MVTLSNNVKRGCGVDKVQVLNEVLTLPESLHPPSMLQNPRGAIKPPASLSVNSLSHSLSGITGVSGSTCAEIEPIGFGEEDTCVHKESHLPRLRRLGCRDAYWDVEYDHMTFFNRHRYSGHDSFKTVLSKARRKRFSP